MKIYTIKAYGTYGGGMAVVAANDEHEAIKACSVITDQWDTRYHKPEEVTCIVDQAPADTPRGVLDHFETGE